MVAISGGGVGGGGGIRKKWECLINITKYTRSQDCSHSVISSRPGGRGFFSDKSSNGDKGVTLRLLLFPFGPASWSSGQSF